MKKYLGMFLLMVMMLTGCGIDENLAGDNTNDSSQSKITSYVGYYADINGDKVVDGVIYADLAIGGSGYWNNESYYEYSAVTSGLKEYYESGTYEGDSTLGTNNTIISPVSGTTGKDRFYVIALEDFSTDGHDTFTWYHNAYGKLDESAKVETKENDFGSGKANTLKWMEAWSNETYGTHKKVAVNGQPDLWDAVQNYSMISSESDSSKWFVPSKSELAAFADYMWTTKGCTKDNYESFGLNSNYWTSSLFSVAEAYLIDMDIESMWVYQVSSDFSVRLSATF